MIASMKPMKQEQTIHCRAPNQIKKERIIPFMKASNQHETMNCKVQNNSLLQNNLQILGTKDKPCRSIKIHEGNKKRLNLRQLKHMKQKKVKVKVDFMYTKSPVGNKINTLAS